jgi:hypothetical protein
MRTFDRASHNDVNFSQIPSLTVQTSDNQPNRVVGLSQNIRVEVLFNDYFIYLLSAVLSKNKK